MDQRTPGHIEATGTLPVAGIGTLPVSPVAPEPERSERPAWVQEARSGLEMPGKYLAYEESGRRIVVPVSREWTRIGRSLAQLDALEDYGCREQLLLQHRLL